MTLPKFIYAGPSWAATSYPEDQRSTNLAREWSIPHVSVAARASTFLQQLARVQQELRSRSLPVIWIYNEPLGDITDILGVSFDTFTQASAWQEMSRACNDHCLRRLAALDTQVLLIGGHRDVVDCHHSNVTVGHHSWQKWLAIQSGMSVDADIIQVEPADGGNFQLGHCWGAEIIQRFLHAHQDLNPDKVLLDAIWDMYYFWDELQRRDWFFEVHPNQQGNIEFAKFLKLTVDAFLGEV